MDNSVFDSSLFLRIYDQTRGQNLDIIKLLGSRIKPDIGIDIFGLFLYFYLIDLYGIKTFFHYLFRLRKLIIRFLIVLDQFFEHIIKIIAKLLFFIK